MIWSLKSSGLMFFVSKSWILENFSTRVQSELRRVPLRLGTTNTSWDLQLGFAIFLLVSRIDSRSQTWWRSFRLALAVHHQIHRSCFCCRWAIVRGCFLTSFRHCTNKNALSILRKFLRWLQEYIEKIRILNKHRRWFHSPLEKLPLVGMSASWFMVVACLIWIFGSESVLSNNQSRATLWVLDTRLIVGLRSLIIILITASLSSKKYNWDSPWEECVLVGA